MEKDNVQRQRVMSQSEARFPSPEIEGHHKVTSFGLCPRKRVKMGDTGNSFKDVVISQEALRPSNWSGFDCFRFASLFINPLSIHGCCLFQVIKLRRHIRQNNLKGTLRSRCV